MAEQFIDFDAIPVYRAAVEREQFIRDFAFSGLPETLCGIKVSPLTFRQWIWLMTIESPFLNGGDLRPETIRGDIGAFFWTIAPERRLEAGGMREIFWQRWAKRRFLRQVGRVETLTAIRGIRDYLLAAFQDAPSVTLGGEHRASYFNAGSVIVDRLCQRYGWTDDHALDRPLKRAFLLLKIMDREQKARAGKPTMLFNPSDVIKGQLADKIARNPNCEEARLGLVEMN